MTNSKLFINDETSKPAATVVLLRPADIGFEVLLLQRNKALKFAGSQWVFPGGKMEAEDGINGDDMLHAAKQAAARETQEEAGIELDADGFQFFAHFTTPTTEVKRFATWFLIGALHEHQDIVIDDSEIVNYQWLTPEQALQEHRSGKLDMLPPTYWALLQLSEFDDHDTAIKHIATQENQEATPHFMPKMIMDKSGLHVLLEYDASYQSDAIAPTGLRHRFVREKGQPDWVYIDERLE